MDRPARMDGSFTSSKVRDDVRSKAVSKPRKKRSLFAEDRNGVRYVELLAIMTPLVALIDGLPVTFFGKSNRSYLTLDQAIDWCRKEMEHHDREKYTKIIAVLERAKTAP
jgi:hypothetical protein